MLVRRAECSLSMPVAPLSAVRRVSSSRVRRARSAAAADSAASAAAAPPPPPPPPVELLSAVEMVEAVSYTHLTLPTKA